MDAKHPLQHTRSKQTMGRLYQRHEQRLHIKMDLLQSQKNINILDVTMSIEYGKIEFKTFQKELNTHQYITLHSVHINIASKGSSSDPSSDSTKRIQKK